MKNIELKVQVKNFSDIVPILKRIAARPAGLISQKDTYFNCPGGRMKIREINNRRYELIYYRRPDIQGSKISNCQIIKMDKKMVSELKKIFRKLWGEKAVIIKNRRLWLLGKTRIHLDQVKGLGNYIELETVFNNDDHRKAMVEHRRIISVLRLRGNKKIKESYSDL